MLMQNFVSLFKKYNQWVLDVEEEGVVLSIMQVRSSRRCLNASGFWDLGCTSNFVREGYAKL